jgi:hypothetical protein
MEGAAGRHATRTSMAQLFGDEKYTASILEFLATTEMGMRGRHRTNITVGNFDGPEKRRVQQENPIVFSAKNDN